MKKIDPMFSIGGGVFKSRKFIPKVVDFFESEKGKHLTILQDFPISIEMFKPSIYIKAGDSLKILEYTPFNGITEFGPAEDSVTVEYDSKEYDIDASIAYVLFSGDSIVKEATKEIFERIKRSAEDFERNTSRETDNDENTISHFSPLIDIDIDDSGGALKAVAAGDSNSLDYFKKRGKEMLRGVIEIQNKKGSL